MVAAWAVVRDGVVADSHDASRLVPWWSFTKTVLAAAALVLVRDRVVSLDVPLTGKPYSLRHLLQHRSGVANYGSLLAYHEAVARGDDPWPVPALLDRVEADRLRDTPGEGWEYSNIGYLFVRRLLEDSTGEDLSTALHRLVLHPLGVEGARVAVKRADLDGVTMGAACSYHPGWVYHGLLAGSVSDAAFLLDRLMTWDLLPPALIGLMLNPFVLPGPVSGRPWGIPGYGLGLMIGTTMNERKVAGHTGNGPGSSIAVYRSTQGDARRTVAFFATNEDQARTEEAAFSLLAD